MNASMNVGSDLALFREDLSALKRDVANLIEHMKGGAASTVRASAARSNGVSEAFASWPEQKATARRVR